jgi:hypothetical protein
LGGVIYGVELTGILVLPEELALGDSFGWTFVGGGAAKSKKELLSEAVSG